LRSLFTKDNSGKLVRNFYCLECSAGPFLQADIDNHVLIQTGYGHQTAHYCRNCCNLKLPKLVLPAIGEVKKFIPFVNSGKFQVKEKEADKIVKFTASLEPVTVTTVKDPVPSIVVDQRVTSDELIEEILGQRTKEVEEIVLTHLSGPAIINLVENKTGTRIPVSPKSKKSVLKHAKDMLEKIGLKVFF
jgi:hypothetical protein